MRNLTIKTILSILVLLFAISSAVAEEVQVAVAANFAAPMAKLQKAFEGKTSHTLTVSYGSSGKFYAQIKNDAPFQVFLSADAERPEALEKDELAVAGTKFTYAVGQLALWSAKPGVVDSEGKVLKDGSFEKLAIADPKLAPYGLAAQQTLESLKLWDTVSAKLVRGVDIAQAYQFVESGNAEIGFVALAQLKAAKEIPGSWWLVPDDLHKPIRQQAILLKKGADSKAAREFLDFLKSKPAREVIKTFGYQDE